MALRASLTDPSGFLVMAREEPRLKKKKSQEWLMKMEVQNERHTMRLPTKVEVQWTVTF